jgi:hypothetical protein
MHQVLKQRPALSASQPSSRRRRRGPGNDRTGPERERTRLQAKLTGFRTKLTARLLAIAGILVGFHDELLPLVSGQDWTSLTAKPPTWSIPLGMVLIAWLFDRLRKITENPPHVILQKDDAGVPKVVAIETPAS